MPGDGAELVAEPFLSAGGIAVQIPVQGLDKKEAGVELVAQFFRERKIEFPVKLNSVQPRRPESDCNLIEILGVKDADFCEIGRQIGHHGCDVTGGDTARTGSEDEADGVRTGVRGRLHIFEIGVAADFDPHGF